ncbi:MAG: 16S rRNA (uracil(1498)-N(3))-methyltransferase [Pedosphaera sp.]|nr:16S rRNA (uracil(1498)-N(3))-methyltransferase [Pedosphaera sp.]
MHRFHLPPEQCRGATLALTGSEAHHAARVLRVQPSERVTVLDGAGGEFLCEVAGVDKREVQLTVRERKIHPPSPCQITLLQAIPKGKIIESIIEKATELGAHRIVPLLTERVATRLNKAESAEKGVKWQQVAVEAIKQCGAAWLPKVEAPLTPKEFLACAERFDLSLVGALQGDAHHPREVLGAFEKQHGSRPRSVAIWIGPEGDLTLDELKLILTAGAKPITLGPLVLRVETAAIYCLSFLNYELRTAPA